MSETPKSNEAIIFKGSLPTDGNEWDDCCNEISDSDEVDDDSLIDGWYWGDVVVVPADFHPQLERELAAALARVRELEREIDSRLWEQSGESI